MILKNSLRFAGLSHQHKEETEPAKEIRLLTGNHKMAK